MRANRRDLTFYSSLVRVCRCVDRYRKLASSVPSSFSFSLFPSLLLFVPFELVSRGVFVPLLGERSNIILTDAVHDMEKRSANEKTSYGGGIKFFTCFQTCFLIRRTTYGTKCRSITPGTSALIPTPSSSNRDSILRKSLSY